VFLPAYFWWDSPNPKAVVLYAAHYTWDVVLLPHIWILTSNHQLWCCLYIGSLLSGEPVLGKKPYMVFVLENDKAEGKKKKKRDEWQNDPNQTDIGEQP